MVERHRSLSVDVARPEVDPDERVSSEVALLQLLETAHTGRLDLNSQGAIGADHQQIARDPTKCHRRVYSVELSNEERRETLAERRRNRRPADVPAGDGMALAERIVITVGSDQSSVERKELLDAQQCSRATFSRCGSF